MTVSTRSRVGPPVERGTAGRGFRPEIQALRTIAILGVVLFHLWPNRLTGGYIGVDVFFVVSGYLITSHLLRELETDGKISLSRFYARRIRRLLPAAMLVLAASAIATAIFVPAERARAFLGEVVASALYVQNWVLAINATDYFAHGEPASPVQHYWSLSVEEQFYIVWPMLFLVAGLLAARLGRRRRRAVLLTVVGVFAVSFVYSAIITATAPQFAYFATPAHAWEFAAGSLLVFAPRKVDGWFSARPGAAASALWVGIALIIGSMVLFTGATPVPGVIALIPVVGTLLVIAASRSDLRWSPTPILSSRPVQFVGDVSYSAYLWHWPLIVLVPYALGHDLTTIEKIAIFVLTIVLAWATRNGVEAAVLGSARWRPRRVSYGFAVVSSALVVALAVVPIVVMEQQTRAQTAQALEQIAGDGCVGASALLSRSDCPEPFELDSAFATDTATYESLSAQVVESAGMDATCRDSFEGSRDCVFNEGGDAVIALVGDSHAEHLEPALAYQAVVEGWEIRVYTKRSCPIVDPGWVAEGAVEYKQNDPACVRWRDRIIADLAADQDVDVVVPVTYAHRVGLDGTEADVTSLANAFARTWTTLTEAGRSVVVVADTPVARSERMAECLAEESDAVACANPRRDALPPDPIAQSVAGSPSARVIDLTDGFCDSERCYAAVGGIAVYRDSHHLTPRFALSLGPLMTAELRDAVAASAR